MNRSSVFRFSAAFILFLIALAGCNKKENTVAIIGVSLTPTTLRMTVGDEQTLQVDILPEDATDKRIIWVSDNPDVATVKDGNVKAVSDGNAIITVKTADGGKTATCDVAVLLSEMPLAKLEAEQLPDLRTARSDHIAFVANGEIVVAGGHKTGFEPSNTAEYFKDGEWAQITMKAAHDFAFSVRLSDDRMMIGGGCSSGGGVGQSKSVDIYDPTTHSFQAGANMITARTMPGAVEIADGKILVSGNWYADDGLEMYNPTNSAFEEVKPVSVSRYIPYLFRTAADNAVIFTNGICDRYNGDAFEFPLFETWRPVVLGTNWRSSECAIGEYSYLLLLQDKSSSNNFALAKLEGESLSLVETDFDFPWLINGDAITYSGQVFTVPENKTAYVLGYSGTESAPVYIVMTIDYGRTPARVSMKATDPLNAFASIYGSVLHPDGRLVLTGGIYNSNYSPYATVWALKP